MAVARGLKRASQAWVCDPKLACGDQRQTIDCRFAGGTERAGSYQASVAGHSVLLHGDGREEDLLLVEKNGKQIKAREEGK